MPRDLALRPGLRLSFLITGIIGFLLGDWPAIALHSSGLLPAQVLLPSQIVALRFSDLSPSQIVALRFPDLSPSQIRPRQARVGSCGVEKQPSHRSNTSNATGNLI
jgi:hypothetical protein